MKIYEIEALSRTVGVLEAISMCKGLTITDDLASLAGQMAKGLGIMVQLDIEEEKK